ncbi:hypothetical protein [Pedobacter rhizosphaerae]|uniref:TerB family tellurite resistance protein n=1 Tax=Pedobacter rhizosphaerae TaxID=390241 RepID=A0A1H9SZQ0_9SPHI|nr:hypothetical protein [Pedobacter rhizosphaerae]SER90351.1 hypothetical protein SAMN04488023_12021 [Pedobacter rhizosphaerae]
MESRINLWAKGFWKSTLAHRLPLLKPKQIKIGIIALLIGLTYLSNASYAQTFGEFFNQKKTQKRYLLEQIAALQVYLDYARKGYKLVDGGLQTVRDITGGEFSLHGAFISSLKTVSPAVRKNVKVAEIIDYQFRIAKWFGEFKGNAMLSAGDQLYVLEVKTAVLADCARDLESLLMLVTSGRLEMEEAERIVRIDLLYEQMRDRAAFTADFMGTVERLVRNRERDGLDILELRRGYGFE